MPKETQLKRVRRPENSNTFFLVDSTGKDVGGPYVATGDKSGKQLCEEAREQIESRGGGHAKKPLESDSAD